jgi:flagellar basal-body rod protein FlgC
MNLYDVLSTSASGLSAQRKRVEVLAQNIANSETTRTQEGGPYRRRRVVFEARPENAFGAVLRSVRTGTAGFGEGAAAGVRVSRVEVDPVASDRRYLPDHPDAGPDGYVEFPGFNPVEDMVDLTAAVRAYQANLAVTSAVKEMIHRTLDLLR